MVHCCNFIEYILIICVNKAVWLSYFYRIETRSNSNKITAWMTALKLISNVVNKLMNARKWFNILLYKIDDLFICLSNLD